MDEGFDINFFDAFENIGGQFPDIGMVVYRFPLKGIYNFACLLLTKFRQR